MDIKKAAQKRLGIRVPTPPDSKGTQSVEKLPHKSSSEEYYSFPTKARFDRAPLKPGQDEKWKELGPKRTELIKNNDPRPPWDRKRHNPTKPKIPE